MDIAVIDNWISSTGPHKKTGRDIQMLLVHDKKCIPQVDTNYGDSHGTIGASILAEALPEHIHLIGYSCPGDAGRPSIKGVCTALQDCLEKRPAYISMSIGSENWLETARLAELTKKLADVGTRIFAACANKGYIAFPAAYPWVTGPIENTKELLALLQRESYQAALLTDRVETDWNHMILHVTAEKFAAWVKPLSEAGILLLDIEGDLATMQRYSGYTLHLGKSTVPATYEEILQFFGTEEGGE